jgi:hypothetical protein
MSPPLLDAIRIVAHAATCRRPASLGRFTSSTRGKLIRDATHETEVEMSDHDDTIRCEVCDEVFAGTQERTRHQRDVHATDPAADAERRVEDPPPADLYSAGPSTGETPASPVQHGA